MGLSEYETYEYVQLLTQMVMLVFWRCSASGLKLKTVADPAQSKFQAKRERERLESSQ